MNLLLPEIDWAALKDLALFSLVIYAALLSTINWRRAQNNDQIEEFAESKIIVSAGSIIVFRGPAYAQVTAVNAGNDPVTVMLLTFEAPGGTRLLVALAGCQCLFLCVQPRRRMARHIVASLSC